MAAEIAIRTALANRNHAAIGMAGIRRSVA